MTTTTATPSRTTTTSAFPLKYFVVAFAFTWVFWWPVVLGVRHVIRALPDLQVIGTFEALVAAVVEEGDHRRGR
jgi:hypothetical protein